MTRFAALSAALCALLLLPGVVLAQATLPEIPALTMTPTEGGGAQWSLSLQVLAAMTLLSVLPALLMSTTGFARIIIVLALLRQALGTQSTPSNPILIGLALLLTGFVMQPTFERAWNEGVGPYLDGTLPLDEAAPGAAAPLREFMLRQTRDSDLLMFAELGGHGDGFAEPADVPLTVLAAAFLTSELKTAFQIGFLLFIPFVIIDLVVASVLMSLGMMMLSPMMISLPFKLMLFVLVDGWTLVAGSLVGSFVS